MTLSKKIKENIYRLLLPKWSNIISHQSVDQMDMLAKIWDLRSMPSEDARYSDAWGDIVQHTINNDDWEIDTLFLDRLKLFSDDRIFLTFVEVFLDPIYYGGDELDDISLEVDTELNKEKLRLVIEDFDENGRPVQKIHPMEDINNLPFGIKMNNIPFYISTKINKNTIKDKTYFVLWPNLGWNDYHVKSIFRLGYFEDGNNELDLGYIKIIHKNELVTADMLEDRFTLLDTKFCSISENMEYYLSLKGKFGYNGMVSILHAIQDVAYFPDIHEEFSRTENFKKSIIRNDDGERNLRQVRPLLQGLDPANLYKFTYNFQPIYSDHSVKIDFDFNDRQPLPNRIFAIIGKNGTGKTQLVTSLPQHFSRNNAEPFGGKMPMFSKVIAISYSAFDNFSIPNKNATFNYLYCGLKDKDGSLRTNKSLLLTFHHNWKKILTLERGVKWRSILYNFIDENIVNTFVNVGPGRRPTVNVDIEGFNKIKNKFSSGQSIILFIITEVIANIRYDSLILYDEPETHLHPNAIVQLMNTVYELVNEFESYCIMATHSPLVIRELFSKNVLIMERNEDFPSIRKIGLECFGENLGILNDEVFGGREIPKQYKKIITELATSGYDYDQIISLLEFDNRPLSLNASMYIRNVIGSNEKS
ncbi:AAA family ATPase [Pedobacter sp. MR22-3]|uniref:AbiJ-related protein n=1 Tax=Pedobacter sp. MR22-3 TaxID=2994552 RepID=UPI0022470175|nr:AAA family ATPase [Pedobacter sp. MR22-3]MCX2584275.1 AAA family ATPase [Pedobacter sp. MR22-3]